MTSQTPPGPGAGSGASAAAAPTDWAKVFDDLGTFGQAIVKRFAERASDNAKKVRDGKYGTNELIEDAEWFWKNLGDDAVAGIEIFRSKPPASST
jgi:hypothetical protein